MKRHGNLYPLIYDMDNIRLAHKNAKKGKAHYREVREIDKDPERYFKRIHYMLKNKAFHNSRYSIFHKQDGNKVREIYRLPYFPDRIIHHCIMQVIEPILFKNLINDTYACIKGRGIHKGVKRIKAALRDEENTKYCLKMDIQKFYPSINHEVLIHLLKRRIKDDDLIWLLSEIVHSAPGVPIGNYLSQHFGNLYLSELDHKCKEQWLCKYYYRYCDDVVILHSSKQFLYNVLSKMRQHLTSSILTIKRNWQIFPVDVRGIDFLGYRFFRHYTLLRKRIATRFKRKMLNIKELNKKTMNVIMSYKGWLKWSNCFNLEHRYIDSILVGRSSENLMGIHSEAGLNRKFMEFAKVMNVYLNHFPAHEKYALANRIRNTAYEMYDFITEGQKRYYKKTSLTGLDIIHENHTKRNSGPD